MKALLLSAYAAQSHVYWRQGLQAMFPDWQWTVLELPPRYFSWRVRGNPLSWAISEKTTLGQRYDVLVATSMVDLATLRGLVPSLAAIPSLLYFHENQFDYPQHRQQHSLLEAQMVNLYSALAADRVAFNSEYNRETFTTGCDQLLGRLPDRVPAGVSDTIRQKSVVLPVPLLPEEALQPLWPGSQGDFPGRPLRILWSARFEHDKGGEGLQAILHELERRGMCYELAVTGQQFRSSPAVFAEIEAQFSHRLVQYGYIESVVEYRALQQGADLVLSTALHEFQGLAVLQAVRAGCLPVVPDRLAYRELFPPGFRYTSSLENPAGEARAAADLLEQLSQALSEQAVSPPGVEHFTLEQLAPVYGALMLGLAGAAG